MAIQLNTLQVGYVSICRLLYGSGLIGWWKIIPLTHYSHSTEYIASGICVHLQIINKAIQLNTLQVGYVSICRLLYGSDLIGWWKIIPLTHYSHSTEYIASGICVHLQIVNKAIQLNTLQVGYVSICRLLYGSGLIGWWKIIPLTHYSHSTEYIASGICVHLQIINKAIQLNTLQVGYVSICRLLYGSGLIGWWKIIPLTHYSHSTEYIASGICVHLQIINKAIQLNTLQVGYVSTCRLLNSHSTEYIASGICVHLQFIKWPFS